MIVRSLMVGALVLVPAAIARADGCPRNPGNPGPAPAPMPQSAPEQPGPLGAVPAGDHGGSIVVLGAAQNRFEVVHDASLGKVTVYAVVPAAPASRSVSFSQAPTIRLDGGRELTLVAVPGETNVWAVTDDSLRGGTLAGSLSVRSNDRWETAALTAPASSSPALPANPSRDNPSRDPATPPAAPAVPTSWSEPAAAHGGRILAACGGSFEFVRDAATGKATLYLLPQGPSKITLDADPVLAVKSATGDPRTLPMTAIAGSTNAWEVTVDVFKGDAEADGTVKVSMDGRPCELNLRDVGPGNAATSGAIALHGGRMLMLGEGANLLRLEIVHDPAIGKVTVFAPAATDARLDAPVLVLKTDAGSEKRVTLTKDADGSWSASEDALKATTLSGTLEAKVGESSLSAPLPASSGILGSDLPANRPAPPREPAASEPTTPVSPGVKTPGGDVTAQPQTPGVKVPGDKDDANVPATTALVFGGGIAKFELRRDAGLGRLTLTTPSDVRSARLDGAPVLVLETPAGKKELTFDKGASDGTWTLTSDELKATSPMKGVVRITIEGKQLEADAAPQFADAKPVGGDMR